MDDSKSRLADLKKQLIQPVQIVDSQPVKKDKDVEENDVLTYRQKQFCIEYLKSGNGLQSAIAAGYSKKGAKETASRLLTYDNIKQELNRLQQLAFRSSNINKEYIIQEILTLMQDSYNDEKTDRATITKCLDMLNKMQGHYNDQTNIQINNFNGIDIEIIKPSSYE